MSSLIIDNWSLQDITDCLFDGLSEDTASELLIDKTANSHNLQDVPASGVMLESLLGFLVDIVLRDQLIVDADFTSAWVERDAVLSEVTRAGLLRSLRFREADGRLTEPRKLIIDQLCVTPSLVEAQRANEESWRDRRQAVDRYMSQVVWGTAGMLSRSHVFEAPYSGHPLRRRLIEQTIMVPRRRDAVADVTHWITEERFRLFTATGTNTTQRQASLVLPPIAVEIINEAATPAQLIPVAVQMRDKHKKLREWLREIQLAVDSEDAAGLARFQKTLNAVAKDIERQVNGDSKRGTVSLEIGFSLPSISINVGTLQGLFSRFGVRAVLSQQVFAERGEQSLRKLITMFGERDSRVGIAAYQYLLAPRF
jgi:hypothetical protein